MGTWETKTPPNMILWKTSPKNLSKFGWTLILEIRPSPKHDFCSSIIWNNSSVRMANRPFFYKHWAEAGVQNNKISKILMTMVLRS